jgi:beta-RFAP synthase
MLPEPNVGVMVIVETGARIHAGFQNLSLAHDRLYGGVGVGLSRPRIVVEAAPAGAVRCADPAVESYVERVVEALGVPGAEVSVRERFQRHVGLGSGTQLALASLLAVARAHDRAIDPRTVAPAIGRGGRSGVGVAAFEAGGFVVDAGHPTELFTAAPPEEGDWTVPPVTARHDLPADWRFVVVVPDIDRGRSGDREDQSMRTVVERADAAIGDEIAGVMLRQVLPAAATGDLPTFGDGLSTVGRLNGAWYADEQGGVYRPPAGRLLERLTDCPAVAGAGQSSWGPAVWGLCRVDAVGTVRDAATAALETVGADGRVLVAAPSNRGARVN